MPTMQTQIAESLKEQIILGVSEYAKTNRISNNEMARLTEVNPSYISNMMRNNYNIVVDGKEIPIGDKWFFKLAEWANISIKKSYWGTVRTMQFIQILPVLEQAKQSSRVSVIIAPTGSGKTYAVDKFCHQHPQYVFKITVNSVQRLPDVLKELIDKVGVQFPQFSVAGKLSAIIDKIRVFKRNGHSPMIIIDEAENLPLPVLKMLKGLYDGVHGYGSIVLIGTDQLIHKLDRLRKHDREGIPQLYRRIKAGIRYIHGDKDFSLFFDRLNINDKGLRRLLTSLCENYGELNDYLEPALREADDNEKPLTEDLFRIMYNLPK